MTITTARVAKEWNDSYDRLFTDVQRTISQKLTSQNDSRNSEMVKIAAYEVHYYLSVNYQECGERVKKYFRPFRPWFIVPWLAYSFEVSMNAKTVLSTWWEDKVGFSSWVQEYALAYNIAHFCLLLVQYLCGIKMNESHQNYYHKVCKLQMNAYDTVFPDVDSAETNSIELSQLNSDQVVQVDDDKMKLVWKYKAVARSLQITNQINYNFSPTAVSYTHLTLPTIYSV